MFEALVNELSESKPSRRLLQRSDLCVGAFDFCSYGEKIEEY